jgi:hypothetical protein
MLAARCFRIVGTIVFLFQFLYFAADRAAMPQYQHFYMLGYAISSADGLFAVVVTRARWFPRYWKPLALVQVGYLDVAGAIMNIFSGTVTPHVYTIITFSFGCATFLPWGVVWQSALNLVCLARLCARLSECDRCGALPILSMDYATRRADPVRISGRVHRSIPPQTVPPA